MKLEPRFVCRFTAILVAAGMLVYEQDGLVVRGTESVSTPVSGPARSWAGSPPPICWVIGDSLGFGVSLFAAAGTWIIDTHQQQGVDWRFGYFYALHREHPLNEDSIWFLNHRLDQIESAGAVPVVTFYALLDIGKEIGYTGEEAEIVQKVLQNPDAMQTYFYNYIDMLELLSRRTGPNRPVILHVEPDSWGFMMWAMGVEGNSDATSVPVKVAGSGHPDVQGFADNAAGLGQALVYLRNRYAPDVFLGWHASNSRVGTRPDVVVGFFSNMGQWDVLVTDQPHMHQPGSNTPWWEPWDTTLVNRNLNWFSTVTSGTGLPILIWQDTLGNDYHLIGNWTTDKTMLTRLASAGVVGYMFEHLNHCGDSGADNFRGRNRCVNPPGGQPGGRGRDYRDRVLAYQNDPLTWPDNSPCAVFSAPTALRVAQALTSTGRLTVTLQWVPPAQASIQELRYSSMPITEGNWADASVLSNTLPGTAYIYTESLPYTGGTRYFALKAKSQTDTWSALSNNAFWPHFDIFLPLVLRAYVGRQVSSRAGLVHKPEIGVRDASTRSFVPRTMVIRLAPRR